MYVRKTQDEIEQERGDRKGEAQRHSMIFGVVLIVWFIIKIAYTYYLYGIRPGWQAVFSDGILWLALLGFMLFILYIFLRKNYEHTGVSLMKMIWCV